jgi:hypothetical protein
MIVNKEYCKGARLWWYCTYAYMAICQYHLSKMYLLVAEYSKNRLKYISFQSQFRKVSKIRVYVLSENITAARKIFCTYFRDSRYREAAQPFRFLLSPFSLRGTWNNSQNCTFLWQVETEARVYEYIVSRRPKTGIVESEEMCILGQRLGKHIPAAPNTQATIEELSFLCNGEVNMPL